MPDVPGPGVFRMMRRIAYAALPLLALGLGCAPVQEEGAEGLGSEAWTFIAGDMLAQLDPGRTPRFSSLFIEPTDLVTTVAPALEAAGWRRWEWGEGEVPDTSWAFLVVYPPTSVDNRTTVVVEMMGLAVARGEVFTDFIEERYHFSCGEGTCRFLERERGELSDGVIGPGELATAILER